MLGSFGSTLGKNGMDAFRGRPLSSAATKQEKNPAQQLNQLAEHEWSELPYAMMRITAARRAWDANRLYWRDCIVQLGEIDLRLHKTRARQDVASYTITYSHEELRRDFPLDPSIEDNQLRWHAPKISEVRLSTDQLAEKLLNKLLAFYTSGLS